jgi:hypothetical protein
MDEEVRVEPPVIYGAAGRFVSWNISLLYFVPVHYVDWKNVGFRFNQEDAC